MVVAVKYLLLAVTFMYPIHEKKNSAGSLPLLSLLLFNNGDNPLQRQHLPLQRLSPLLYRARPPLTPPLPRNQALHMHPIRNVCPSLPPWSRRSLPRQSHRSKQHSLAPRHSHGPSLGQNLCLGHTTNHSARPAGQGVQNTRQCHTQYRCGLGIPHHGQCRIRRRSGIGT